MKKIIITILILAILIFSTTGCNRKIGPGIDPGEESHVGTIEGWLFEVESETGTQKFLVRGSPEQGGILNEQEIIEITRQDSWQEPTLIWTLEEWLAECEKQKSQIKECTEETWESENQEWLNECELVPNDPICPPKLYDYEDWETICTARNENLENCQFLPHEDFENMIQNYLDENSIQGIAIDSYVAMFAIRYTQ